MSIQHELRRIVEARETLSRGEALILMQRILDGEAADVEIAALLGALAGRGETAEEVAGFASAMRAVATTLPLSSAEQASLVDTCGTGGDASGSFNISTAAALVAAAAGAKVAKHGNRAITSRCGSADVLDALDIPTTLAPEEAVNALRQHGFCFLLAPSHHPAMKAVMPVRRAMGVRTVLHVLGPLLNPAGARRQVMGVYSARLVPLVAEAMTMLGIQHAFVVHGDGGLDELALSGPSEVAEVLDGEVRQYVVTPEDFGLQRAPLSALEGGDATANALILKTIFSGAPGPHRDVVLLNAAAVLVAAGRVNDIREGVTLAAQTIDSGAVTNLVAALAQ
ncbi:anthranilate phosphoribosyltransferase [Granulicella mallensis]|uniref:Anthranilate phosphoribosyltransferase n=1 Tax=Granulicella mallensis (strain ATCC BAA-1857 / DSM 23137 / MP5ACTX8) TaxID=682795 RepID=G8NQY5_GRAMM|nr:anthranilate phosphoribosyltransferase [Granulicella mallensis]AEU34970.1 anthranilate phosphoribosyltransferase [Granulicella mallensis MP5ACTX8]